MFCADTRSSSSSPVLVDHEISGLPVLVAGVGDLTRPSMGQGAPPRTVLDGFDQILHGTRRPEHSFVTSWGANSWAVRSMCLSVCPKNSSVIICIEQHTPVPVRFGFLEALRHSSSLPRGPWGLVLKSRQRHSWIRSIVGWERVRQRGREGRRLTYQAGPEKSHSLLPSDL